MSNAVFLRPDENGNWGKVGSDPIGNMSEQLVFQSGATALGNGTIIDVGGYSTLVLRITISGTATVTFEMSTDNTNWVTLTGVAQSSNATGSSTSATNDYRFALVGVKYFRARISVYASGTVDVIGYASTSPFYQQLTVSAYGNSDSNSSTVNMNAVGAYNLLYDGTNWARQRSATAIGDGTNNGSIASVALTAFNGTNWDRVRSVNTGQLKTTLYNPTGGALEISALGSADGNSGLVQSASVANYNFGYNGASWSRVRVSQVYKYIEYLNLANATATTVWTPASTKKFRLMGVSISCGSTGNKFHLRAGTAGSGTAFYTFRSTGSAGDTQSFYFGNGYLATNVNDVLEIYNATGATADVWVTAWGTEE